MIEARTKHRRIALQKLEVGISEKLPSSADNYERRHDIVPRSITREPRINTSKAELCEIWHRLEQVCMEAAEIGVYKKDYLRHIYLLLALSSSEMFRCPVAKRGL
jgi:hypothetical protein